MRSNTLHVLNVLLTAWKNARRIKMLLFSSDPIASRNKTKRCQSSSKSSASVWLHLQPIVNCVYTLTVRGVGRSFTALGGSSPPLWLLMTADSRRRKVESYVHFVLVCNISEQPIVCYEKQYELDRNKRESLQNGPRESKLFTFDHLKLQFDISTSTLHSFLFSFLFCAPKNVSQSFWLTCFPTYLKNFTNAREIPKECTARVWVPSSTSCWHTHSLVARLHARFILNGQGVLRQYNGNLIWLLILH